MDEVRVYRHVSALDAAPCPKFMKHSNNLTTIRPSPLQVTSTMSWILYHIADSRREAPHPDHDSDSVSFVWIINLRSPATSLCEELEIGGGARSLQDDLYKEVQSVTGDNGNLKLTQFGNQSTPGGEPQTEP